MFVSIKQLQNCEFQYIHRNLTAPPIATCVGGVAHTHSTCLSIVDD